jgi:cell division protease FtsH
VVDDAVRSLLQEAEDRAEEVIRIHRAKIERLLAELEKQETQHREQIEDCLSRDGPEEEKAKKIARIN